MDLLELPPGDPLWDVAFPVLAQLRDHLDRATFDRVHAHGAPQGLRFTAAFAPRPPDRAGLARASATGGGVPPAPTCLAVAGWRVVDATSVVRKLFIDDLVVDAAHRSEGLGAVLLAHLEQVAAEVGARCVELDSGHQRTDAHRFYRRAGYRDTGLTFRKGLPD